MTVKKNDRHINEVLNGFIHQKKISTGFFNSRVKQLWAELMGQSIHGHTTGIELKKSILFLRIDSSVLKHELFLEREKLKNLLNKHLGEEVIEKIIFQ